MSSRRLHPCCACLLSLAMLVPCATGAERRTGSSATAVALARAAVERAHAHPAVAAAWIRRIRAAAWLPELKAGVEKEMGTREAIDPTDRTRYGTYALDQLRLDVRASWRLDRLVFDPEELRAAREGIRLAELRQDLALLVIRLYYERRRLELERSLGPSAPPREAAISAVRIDEITSALEALCGSEGSAAD